MERDEHEVKREVEKYIQIAAKAASKGDLREAERVMQMAEELYPTPLGKKILTDIHNLRADKSPSNQSICSEISNESCEYTSCKSCETSSDISSDDDDTDYLHQEEYLAHEAFIEKSPILEKATPIRLITTDSINEACASLEEAEKYFLINEAKMLQKCKKVKENKGPSLLDYKVENRTRKLRTSDNKNDHKSHKVCRKKEKTKQVRDL